MARIPRLGFNKFTIQLIMAVIVAIYVVQQQITQGTLPTALETPSPSPVAVIASPTPTASSSGEVAGTNRESVQVSKVIDGDTIELSDGRKVRYIGIDTPETQDPRRAVECFGKEAAARNSELVLNKTVELETDISDKDKYGRLLRYVTADGQFINQVLVSEGYARSYTYPPDVKYQSVFNEAEKAARSANKGLWGSECKATLPKTWQTTTK